jgi:hypothetical protein
MLHGGAPLNKVVENFIENKSYGYLMKMTRTPSKVTHKSVEVAVLDFEILAKS